MLLPFSFPMAFSSTQSSQPFLYFKEMKDQIVKSQEPYRNNHWPSTESGTIHSKWDSKIRSSFVDLNLKITPEASIVYEQSPQMSDSPEHSDQCIT